MVPYPVTTPSPRNLFFSMPKLYERCSTNMSNSSKLPSSKSISIRSRAVYLPFVCCDSILFSPPPIRAFSRNWINFFTFSSWLLIQFVFFIVYNDLLFFRMLTKFCKNSTSRFWMQEPNC